MSLIEHLTRHTLCVHLAPQQLSCVVRKAGKVVAGSAARIAIDNPGCQWQLPLAALRTFLAQAGRPGAGLPLAVSLSSRWCQMTMAPWSDALLSDLSAQRFLQTQLAALYGECVRGWSIASDDAPYGQPRLVCGIDRELLQGLQDIATEHGQSCRSVESVLTLAWRAIAATKPKAFALIEPGRLVMAAVAGGRIVALQTQPCPADWHGELARAWQRWTLRAPELADIDNVAVLDLSGAAASELGPGFSHVAANLTQLGPAHLMKESPWA